MKPEGEKGRKMKTFELLSRDYTLFLLVFFLLSFFFLSSFIPLSLFLSLSVFCFSFVSLFPFRGKKTICLWCFSFLLRTNWFASNWRHNKYSRIQKERKDSPEINWTTSQSIHLSHLNTEKERNNINFFFKISYLDLKSKNQININPKIVEVCACVLSFGSQSSRINIRRKRISLCLRLFTRKKNVAIDVKYKS